MVSARDERRQRGAFLKTKLVVSAVVLLFLTLGFNALLNSASLEKLYVESLASSYQVIGKDLQIKLETAVRFGKNIEKFIGINTLLHKTLSYMTGQDLREGSNEKGSSSVSGRFVSVALPDGRILYSTNEGIIGSRLPIKSLIDYGEASGAGEPVKTPGFIEYKGTYFVTLPVRDWAGNWIATAVLGFDENQVKALLTPAIHQNVKIAGVTIVFGTILLFVALNLILPRERERLEGRIREITKIRFRAEKRRFSKRRIQVALFLIIIACQVVFSTFSALAFKDDYLSINKEKSTMLITLLRNDIEYLLGKGLQIDRLLKIEVMMGKILPALPEASDIAILSVEGYVLYWADQQGVVDYTKDPDADSPGKLVNLAEIGGEYNVHIDIMRGAQNQGYISTNLSREVVFSKLREIILDSMTILLMAVFFSVELLFVIFQFIEKQAIQTERRSIVHYGAIRPAAFLFLFGVDISISFLPLHMEKLYEPIWGLSKDVVMGLPISVEMFFAGIAILAAGAWIDRRGWHEPFFVGLILAGLGILLSWTALDALSFIISRGVVGIGYGLSWMALQGFVIAYTDEKSKTQGLAQLVAGIIAGSICGGAAGAMLAQRIGYYPVFLIGAVIVFSVMIYTVVFLRSTLRKPDSHTREPGTETAEWGKIIKVLFSRDVFSLILLSALPAAVAIVGFLYYFSPVYLNRIGISQSTIGRIFMVYGICLVYVSPFFSKYIDASTNKRMYVVVSGILASMAFMVFFVSEGITAVVLTVLLLGLSSSFSESQRSYLLKLQATQAFGAGKTMGLFNSSARVGQVFGPLLFGWIVVSVGVKRGISYFGLVFLSITLLFVLLSRSDRKIAGSDVL
jgi:predicted MFS family arabinose efflux permease